jgi:hypothetical protein
VLYLFLWGGGGGCGVLDAYHCVLDEQARHNGIKDKQRPGEGKIGINNFPHFTDLLRNSGQKHHSEQMTI